MAHQHHNFDVEPGDFREVRDGERTYLLIDQRDRSLRGHYDVPDVGDQLTLREWVAEPEFCVGDCDVMPGRQTGKTLDVDVIHKTESDDGLQRDWYILGIRLAKSDDRTENDDRADGLDFSGNDDEYSGA